MESFRALVADVRAYIHRIIGEVDWRSEPAINLHDTSAQIKAILGESDDMAVPDINLNDASSQIAAIIGLGNDMSVPDITLHEASNQIAAIIGEGSDSATPDIHLAATKVHVDTTPSTGTAHGITGWATVPVALGASALAGTATTISRSDHVHPTTGLMTTAHAANAITGFGANALALVQTQTGGDSNQVSRADHQHALPASLWSIASQTWAIDEAPYFSATNTVSKMTVTSAARGLLDDTTATAMRATLGVSAAGSYNSPTDGSNTLTGPTVYKRIVVVDGLVTSMVYRDLTPADIGAVSPTTALTALGNLTPAANRVPYFSGTTTAGLLTLSTIGTNLLGASSETAARGYITAAALGGSGTQDFAAQVLTADSVTVDDGVTEGVRTASAAFAFSGTATVALGNGGLYVKNYANTAYTAANASAFTVGSDEVLKKDIRPMRKKSGLSALNRLAQDGIIHYRLKNDPDTVLESTGFSAQKVALAAPLASRVIESTPENGDILGWDMGAMMAMVVDSLAEISERLTALETAKSKS